MWEEQPMRKPRIEKVVVNISVGKSGEPLEKATNVLKELTNQTPSKRKVKKTIRDFGIRKGESTACIVTLRRQEAIDFLKKVLPVVDNKLSRSSFDKHGNFAFGIKEHIEIAGVKYD
ncbi:MAG: 50S ribosomal protein L5, partial [Candidatus Bathyarchaeia archaeon]